MINLWQQLETLKDATWTTGKFGGIRSNMKCPVCVLADRIVGHDLGYNGEAFTAMRAALGPLRTSEINLTITEIIDAADFPDSPNRRKLETALGLPLTVPTYDD